MTGKVHNLCHRHFVTQQQVFTNARAWNAETPNTYTLVVSTFDAQGKPQESFTHLLASVPWK